MLIRLALIASVLALCAGVLYIGVNGFGVVAGGLGSTVGGFVAGVTSTPSPRPVVQVVSDPSRKAALTSPDTATTAKHRPTNAE